MHPPPAPYLPGSETFPRAAEGTAAVLGVVGASGGVGASTLAAACAVRATAAGVGVVLVDGSPFGGGVDVLLGLEHEPGLRWRDLAAARGVLDGAALLGAMPAAEGCRVLSFDRGDPRIGGGLRHYDDPGPVVQALGAVVELVVLDLPGPGRAGAERWWECVDEAVLVVGGGVPQCAAAAVAVEVVPRVRSAVARMAAGLPDDVVAATLGLPTHPLAHDPGVVRALVQGTAVGTERGPVCRTAEELVAAVVARGRRLVG